MNKKVGIIDLGSNSVRLVIYEISENGSFRLIDDISDTVRLSENMSEGKYLNESSMHKALNIIVLFKKLCNAYKISDDNIIAFATAAVRKAENRDMFLDMILNSTGIRFRILSGDEEALYVYKAVMQSIDIEDGIIVDIGGGSTEIVSFRNKAVAGYVSIPIGAVVATEEFLEKDFIPPEKIIRLEEHLESVLGEYKWLRDNQSGVLIGLGGTIRNLAKMHKKRMDYPMDITHNYSIDIKDFLCIYDEIKKTDLIARKKIKGLSAKRADIITGGLSIINAIAHISQSDKIVVSGDGVREGVMYDYISKLFSRSFSGVLASSIENCMDLFNVRRDHAEHVLKTALSLFDQLKELHKMGEEHKRLLTVAALLHDIGISVSFYEHYNHTFYIILNSRLNGLTHRELLLSAAAAASHTGDKFKTDRLKQYGKLLKPNDIDDYYKLSMLLRLAEALDRSETGIIKEIDCRIGKKSVIINTHKNGDADLEKKEAGENSEAFSKLFKKQLIIE